MPEDRWSAYVAYRLACVRERIQETEWLMRPPTPEDLLCLHKAIQRLTEQEAYLAPMLGVAMPPGVCDPSVNADTPVIPRPSGLAS
jgi:hypothetical protein